jgi:hypothetical protein
MSSGMLMQMFSNDQHNRDGKNIRKNKRQLLNEVDEDEVDDEVVEVEMMYQK